MTHKLLTEVQKRFDEKFNEVLHRMVKLEIIPDIQSRINERIPERGGFTVYTSEELKQFLAQEIARAREETIEETIKEVGRLVKLKYGKSVAEDFIGLFNNYSKLNEKNI